MSQGVERIEAGESCRDLPRPVGNLNTALRNSIAGLIAEERRIGSKALVSTILEPPESHQLRDQSVGQKQVSGSASLRDLPTKPNSRLGCPVGEEHIPDIEPHDLGKPKASAEAEGDDQVVTGMAC